MWGIPLRPSPPPVTPQTPPEGGQGGGFDWSVATHRSPRPQDERAEHRREKPKKKRGSDGERGRTHWERAEEQKPPAHSSKGGHLFLARGRPEPKARAVRSTRVGARKRRRTAEPRASFFEGCDRGVRIGIWLWVSTACYGAVSAL